MSEWAVHLSLVDKRRQLSVDLAASLPLAEDQTIYEWPMANTMMGNISHSLSAGNNLALEVWLSPGEDAIGKLKCFQAIFPVSDIKTEVTSVNSGIKFSGKPRRNSIVYTDHRGEPRVIEKHNILQVHTVDNTVSFYINYRANLIYEDQMKSILFCVKSVTMNLVEKKTLYQYVRRDDGHRLILMANDRYIGGAQSLEQGDERWVYEWTPGADVSAYSRQEEYDRLILDGLKEGQTTGALMSPRETPRGKTPRPMSQVHRVELVQPPFVPDGPDTANPVARLYRELPSTLKVRLFNFRFTPPRFLALSLKEADFSAAWDRTVACAKTAQKGPVAERGTPKSFRRKKKAEKNSTLYRDLVCSLERSMAPNVVLIIVFGLGEEDTFELKKLSLHVVDPTKTLKETF